MTTTTTPQRSPLRHAYEYRAEKERPGQRLWCDAGGCFMEDCPACRAAVGDALRGLSATTLIICARGGQSRCEHDWQTWGADSRFRLCRKCKRAERLVVAAAEKEGASHE